MVLSPPCMSAVRLQEGPREAAVVELLSAGTFVCALTVTLQPCLEGSHVPIFLMGKQPRKLKWFAYALVSKKNQN